MSNSENVFITSTTETIQDRKFEVIGVVFSSGSLTKLDDATAADREALVKIELDKSIMSLVEQAKSLKADGVIGIRPYTNSVNLPGAIGTAIKFIK